MARLILVAMVALASGHGKMESPQPRPGTSTAGNNKGRNRGPCGAGTQLQTQRTPVANYVAGQQVEVKWVTTIPHGGTCRISLTTESAGVPSNVDGTGRLDGTQNGVYQLTNDFSCCRSKTTESMTVTIPATASCTSCVLQWFWDGDSNYYNCADISITAATTTTTTSTSFTTTTTTTTTTTVTTVAPSPSPYPIIDSPSPSLSPSPSGPSPGDQGDEPTSGTGMAGSYQPLGVVGGAHWQSISCMLLGSLLAFPMLV